MSKVHVLLLVLALTVWLVVWYATHSDVGPSCWNNTLVYFGHVDQCRLW